MCNLCPSAPQEYMILRHREDVGDEKMYVYVTVWKYYTKNDFEYGEEGIYVMDVKCSAIISLTSAPFSSKRQSAHILFP